MTHSAPTTAPICRTRRCYDLLATVVVVALLGSAVAMIQVHGQSRVGADLAGLNSPSYTVADLQQRVAHAPQDWMGRTVRVRGRVLLYRTRSDPFTWQTQLLLIDAGAGRMPLVLGVADPVMTLLRRLPLVGRAMPPQQWVQWGAVMTYRILLQGQRGGPCAACDTAVLLDAA